MESFGSGSLEVATAARMGLFSDCQTWVVAQQVGSDAMEQDLEAPRRREMIGPIKPHGVPQELVRRSWADGVPQATAVYSYAW